MTFLPLIAALAQGPNELERYLQAPDTSYAFQQVSNTPQLADLKMTSQTWQGIKWHHSLAIASPKRPTGDTAILYITGDRVEDKDLPFVKNFAKQAQMPVAALFDIPNQPLFDAREDALIALTFGKYIETGDATWPLLFPMTKAAIRAMDTVQKWSKGKIKKFVVTGASKRGWTTWLVGASHDKRVIGIAPMVFDMLSMQKQLEHQNALWGTYSEEIRDYVDSGLVQIFGTPSGDKLVKMVDPYTYLAKMTIPTLVVLGGNDRYWAVDAHNLYWKDIRGPKLLRIVPNAGHNLNGGVEAAASVAYFANCLTGTIPGGLPADGGKTHRVAKSEWYAGSDTQNFHDSRWIHDAVGPEFSASFTEWSYRYRGFQASFTSPVRIDRFYH